MTSPTDPVAAWASSGAMALTGRADGPPLVAPGRPAAFVADQLEKLGLAVPGLLGERAAYAGLARRGPWSCGGAFRVLRATDGWVGLALPRPSDVALVPALVGEEVRNGAWLAVERWLSEVSAREAEDRLQLLGLAGGRVPCAPAEAPRDRPGVLISSLGRRTPSERPTVVDLSSLWAGPLCAHLLGLRGARVIKVEATTRPDGARTGTPDFFALLHDGHTVVHLDLKRERSRLQDLVMSADLVIEASRPRALRQLGIDAEEVVASGTSWVSITARGRAWDTIGFGDDVAACAGLVLRDGEDLLPVGDALADPLTGVAAATAATDALKSHQARLIDVSMLHVAAEVVGPVPAHDLRCRDEVWWVETDLGRHPVEPPRRR